MSSSNPSTKDGETEAQRGVRAIPEFQSKSGTDPDLQQSPPLPVRSWDSGAKGNLERGCQTEPKEEARVE